MGPRVCFALWLAVLAALKCSNASMDGLSMVPLAISGEQLLGGPLRQLAQEDQGVQPGPDMQVQRCLYVGLKSFIPKCSRFRSGTALGTATGSVNITIRLPESALLSISRDALMWLLRSCINGQDHGGAAHTTKVLLAGGVYARILENITTVYTELTGAPIKIQQEGYTTYSTTLLASLFNPTNTTLTHSVWMLALSGIGDAVTLGSLKDLSSLVVADRRLDWQDLMPVLRTNGLLFNNKVVSLPWVTAGVYLYYRKDVFSDLGIQPAHTWQELIDQAATLNGTDDMYGLCVGYGPCQRVGTILLRNIYVSLVQTRGSDQGWAFDPDSMESLLDSAAMKEAMRIYKALLAVSGPDLVTLPACTAARSLFVQNKCLMSINDNTMIKFASHPVFKAQTGKLHGFLGVSLLPGSPVVLDIPSNTLVQCDPLRCPYAVRMLNSSGLPWLVNSSPGTEVIVLALNQHINDDYAYYAFTVASFISSAAVNDLLLYDPYSEMYPSRYSQLNIQKWIQNGYNGANIQEFLAVHQAALSHPNNNLQLRCAGATLFTQALGVAVNQLNNQTLTIPVELIASELATRAKAVFSRQHGGNTTRQKEEYWESINRRWPVAQPAAAVPVAQLTATSGQDNQLPNGMVALIVCMVVAGAVLVGIAAFIVRRRLLRLSKSSSGNAGHPGVGPLTTLLVTDIQDSTSLWETLDASIMDAAAKLHNVCIRNLAAKYAGYESVWEGDSFVLAFHTPHAALQFALKAQNELLALPWPSELLASPYANEVWVRYHDNGKLKEDAPAKMKEKLDIQKSSPSLHRQDSAGSSNQSDCGEVKGKEADQLLFMSYRDSGAGAASTTPSVDGDPLVKKLGGGSDSASQSTLGTSTAMINAHFKEAQPGLKDTYTVFDLMQTSVTVVGTGTAGSVCVYRGLRVRMGMHSGLANEGDVNYNSRMARYHYTGPLRTTSAAVTSSAHGGMILMSSKVAALLDPDGSGTLRHLPADCQLYHMGEHRLADLHDETLELLQAQPVTLRSRVVLSPTSLRSLSCTLSGSLDAPLPRTNKVALGCTSLVYMRVVGLDTLVAWNKQVTLDALKSVHLCANLETAAHRGVVSEDGLALYARRVQQPVVSALSSSSSCAPGQFASAFPDAVSALHFSIALRRTLLLLDWETDLLQHELGHQLGSNIVADLESECEEAMLCLADAAGVTMGPTQPAGGAAIRSTESTGGPKHRVSKAGGFLPATSGLSFGAGPGSAASYTATEAPQLSTVSMSSSNCANQKPAGSMMSSRLGFFVAPPEPVASMSDHSGPLTPQKMPKTSKRSKSQGNGQQKLAGHNQCILEPPMLRGLRIRQCVITGVLSVAIDTQGSGRAVYRGKPTKQLQALMSSTKAGQILVSRKVMAALFPAARR